MSLTEAHDANVAMTRGAARSWPSEVPGSKLSAMGAWLVLGCGYTGTALARALVSNGEAVTITRRDAGAAATLAGELGAIGRRVELAEPATLAGLISPGMIVACLAQPGPDPAAEIHAL